MERIKAKAKVLASLHENTLVVCHAGVMAYLRKELIDYGFEGPKFGIAEHATLYVFEKQLLPQASSAELPVAT